MCIEECEDLIGESLKSENADEPSEFSAEDLVNIETDVQVKYASVFEQYKEKLDEDLNTLVPAVRGCTKKLSQNILVILRNLTLLSGNNLAERDDNFDSKIYYICQHCHPLLNDNNLPGTCVLNGLYVENSKRAVTTECFRQATCTAG